MGVDHCVDSNETEKDIVVKIIIKCKSFWFNIVKIYWVSITFKSWLRLKDLEQMVQTWGRSSEWETRWERSVLFVGYTRLQWAHGKVVNPEWDFLCRIRLISFLNLEMTYKQVDFIHNKITSTHWKLKWREKKHLISWLTPSGKFHKQICDPIYVLPDGF